MPTRQQWAEARRRAVCASESAAVLGVSPWASALEVWGRKTGALPAYGGDENPEQRWGTLLEPVVAAAYAEQRLGDRRALRHHNQNVLLRHRGFPAVPMAATPDYYGPDGALLEVKTAHAFTASAWDEGVPIQYEVQVQHQLAVTGAPAATLVVLIGGSDLRWFDIERNERFIDNLEETIATWWGSFVEPGVEPPVEYDPKSLKTFERLHPNDSGATVALPADFAEVDRRLLELKAQRSAADKTIKELEGRLKAAIGTATFGQLPTGERYSWKTTERAGYEVAATTFRQLRRMAK